MLYKLFLKKLLSFINILIFKLIAFIFLFDMILIFLSPNTSSIAPTLVAITGIFKFIASNIDKPNPSKVWVGFTSKSN